MAAEFIPFNIEPQSEQTTDPPKYPQPIGATTVSSSHPKPQDMEIDVSSTKTADNVSGCTQLPVKVQLGAATGELKPLSEMIPTKRHKKRTRGKKSSSDDSKSSMPESLLEERSANDSTHPSPQLNQEAQGQRGTPTKTKSSYRGSPKPNSSTPRRGGSTPNSQTPRRAKLIFQPTDTEPAKDSFYYWSDEQIQAARDEGALLEGPIRINPKNYRQGFVALPNGVADAYVPWRNRAMNSDIVAVKLLDRSAWRVLVDDIQLLLLRASLVKSEELESQSSAGSYSVADYAKVATFNEKDGLLKEKLFAHLNVTKLPEKFIQPVGAVVGILERVNTRIASGHIQKHPLSNKLALFVPKDSRVPRIDLPIKSCPKDFALRPQDFSEVLFVARITDWEEGDARARGEMVKEIGSTSNIEALTESLLLEHGIDTDPFSLEVLNCLPQDLPWTIPASEFEYRRDFRSECIFTVDPATARDLDDALSCRKIDSDTYEIGVHIADVSYFVQNHNSLDLEARSRATSVYMVQKVIPMLPRLLCEQLCSLNPDEDRLAFSVVWHIDNEGNITDEWFGRSVIRSCCKLAYQHAQGMIEDPDRVWSPNELPEISRGFTIQDIVSRTLVLDKIAKQLRHKRYANGALRLDQTKLSYAFNNINENIYPTGYSIFVAKDSNKMIEEFMLLANMAVARKIYKHLPETSLLRLHPPPQAKQLDDLASDCEALGLTIDTSSSCALHESILCYREQAGTEITDGIIQIVMQLCMKPMQLAKYFCTGTKESTAEFLHYALNAPFYTHFTSPIRRYPDVLVHRALAASLGYTDSPDETKETVKAQANYCNQKKENAKKAGELSSAMFFVAFLKACGPLVEKAMVIDCLDKAVDVVLIKLGMRKRVYINNLKGVSTEFVKTCPPELIIRWQDEEGSAEPITETLKPFSIVYVRLEAGKDLTQLNITLLSPEEMKAYEATPTQEYVGVNIEMEDDEAC